MSAIASSSGAGAERSAAMASRKLASAASKLRAPLSMSACVRRENDAELDRRSTSASLALLVYPSVTSGFFLKGAIGGMRARFELDGAVLQSDVVTSQLGIGYDIPLGGVSLTPYITGMWTFGGRSQLSGETFPATIHLNALQVGVAFTVP